MSSKPTLVKRTPNQDSRGRPQYLARLPLWKRYPRIFILGGGVLIGCSIWSKQFYNALFLKPEDIPYQADWWPSEIAKGKKTVDQYRERQEKIQFYKEKYEKERAEKDAALAQLEKVKLPK
ncbi:uncharacterized protein LOC110856145 [Folsomia candida]|uniref:Uncharacterized protein n=1 Tax=Folsomia candida TaxID=158441 RepID=A0A226DNQ6_FOLCA|nr:uncharacterized protein LOC110856145 [Folsomia candida]OXA46474.1 hypothetical protein Fcan01_18565 [Folsomia candida]